MQLLNLASAPNDIVKSGKYTIQLCGSQAPQVQAAMRTLQKALRPAIQDTYISPTSAPFTAFFKNSQYRLFVTRVLSDIANGTALASKADSTPTTPQLVCVTGPNIVKFQVKNSFHDVYDDCQQNPLWASIYHSGLNYVFICPLFFASAIPSRPVSRCPTIDSATNEFVGDLNSLIQYKPYVLLHELAHFYVVPPSTENMQFEVYDWNAAFALKAKRAVLNAQSYVLYVASKYRQGLFFGPSNPTLARIANVSACGSQNNIIGIAARCTAFPVPAVPHSRGRRLGDDTNMSNVGQIGGVWANGTQTAKYISLWLGGRLAT